MTGTNVLPHGIYARAADGTVKPAKDVGGCDTTGNAYKPGKTVWTWDGTKFVCVWAAVAVAPASATATYAIGQVTVAWVESSPRVANTYVITRPDGSTAGSAPYGTTNFIDTDPRPGTGKYRVTSSLAGETTGGFVETSNITIAGAPTSPAVSGSVSPVTVTWTNGTNADTYSFQRLDNGTFGSDDPTSPTSLSMTPGESTAIRIYSKINSRLGGSADTGVANVIPLPPSATSLASGHFQVTLNWAPAAGGIVTQYRVEYSTNNGGTWTFVGNSTGTSMVITTSGTTLARVRSEAPGGNSAWSQIGPTTPNTDTTGPGAPTLTSWKPEASYGRMVVRGTWPTDSDTTTGIVLRSRITGESTPGGGGGPWISVYGGSATPGAAFVVDCGTYPSGETPQVQVYTLDVFGNVGTSSFATYGPLIDGSLYVDPTEGRTARDAGSGFAFRTDVGGTGNVIYSGYNGGNNAGCFYYGNQLHDILAVPGRTFVSATIETWRLGAAQGNTQGVTGALPTKVWLHAQTASSDGPPGLVDFGQDFETAGMTRNGTDGTKLDISPFLPIIRDLGYRGFALYHAVTSTNPANPGSFYMQLAAAGALGASPPRVSGRVILNTLG